MDGFVVHYLNREKVQQTAQEFEIAGIDEFPEGELLRKLFQVMLRKMPGLCY